MQRIPLGQLRVDEIVRWGSKIAVGEGGALSVGPSVLTWGWVLLPCTCLGSHIVLALDSRLRLAWGAGSVSASLEDVAAVSVDY